MMTERRGTFRAGTALLLALTFVFCLASHPAVAQVDAADSTNISAVVVDGTVLFEVSGASGLPANRRADQIRDRIISVAETGAGSGVTAAIVESEFGHDVVVDGVTILSVVDVDAAREQIEGTALVARIYGDRVEEAVRTYRLQRSSAARQRGLVNGVIWTVAFAAFIGFLFWLSRWLKRRVQRTVSRYMSAVEEATQEIVRSRAIAEVTGIAVQGIVVILFFVALYYYVSVILFSFAETRPLATVLLNYVTDPIIRAMQSVVDFLPSLVILLIIFFITRYLIKIARVTFESIDAGTVRFEGFQKHWVWPSFNILRAILVIAALILAYPYIPGSDSAAFQGMSILLGVMISIGSNSVMSNVLAGLFVIYRRSTNVGDLIGIGDHIGEVTAIKLTETYLKSPKNELISIPNGQLLNSEVINYSQAIDGRGMILHTEVGIGYDEPQEKIEALLIEAALRTDMIKKRPPPFVFRKALGDFAVTYEINGFSNRGDIMPRVLSDLRANILDVLHEAGVQIMSPHYEGDPGTPKIPPVSKPDEATPKSA